MTQDYIDQLRQTTLEGLADLCRASLASEQIDYDNLAMAVEHQLEIRGENDFARVPESCRKLVLALEQSCDKDLSHVAAKILKSARLAAYTHVVGKDAVYVDKPLEW